MKNKAADYIVTGQWAKKAYQEGQMYGRANAIASSADKTFSYIPDCSDLDVSEDADYVYICENNTIYGTKFWTLPNILTLAFDPSYTGESGGEPRYVASPDINTEDFCAAVDYLSNEKETYIENRMGMKRPDFLQYGFRLLLASLKKED